MKKSLGLFLLLFKISPVFLKLLKTAKVIKLGLASASLMAYSYLFTWEFAIVLLLALSFHEYGHVRAMKKVGIKTKGFYLIPFLGGAAVAEESINNRKDESYISLEGPLYGLLLIIPFIGLYHLTNEIIFIGLASFMALLNLFNLSPINPLDGGRLVKSIAFSLNSYIGFIFLFLGIFFSMFLVYYYKMYLLLFIMIIGTIELIFEIQSFRLKENTMINMNKEDIIKYSLKYILIILSFISIIYYCSSFDGADLALKIIKEEGF